MGTGIIGPGIIGLSSMATRHLLADLAGEIARSLGLAVRFDSGGGVEVEQRVRDGVPADVVVLAAPAMARLDDEGLLVSGTLRPLFVSQVVAAVPADRTAPAFATEDDLATALASAATVAYSTGPSGTALLALIDRLGLTDLLADRMLQAPPGVPVGSLLADGRADLGFQQHSELMDVGGITILGPLPGEAAIRSTFSGAVAAASPQADTAAQVLDLLGSDVAARLAATRGMTLAD